MGGTESQSLSFNETLLNNHLNATVLILVEGGVLTKKINSMPFNSVNKKLLVKHFLKRHISLLNPDLIICMGKICNYYISFLYKNFLNIKIISTLRSGKVFKKNVISSMSSDSIVLSNSIHSKFNFIRYGGFGYIKTISNINPHRHLKNFNKIFICKLKRKLKVKSCFLIFICAAAFRRNKGQKNLIKIIKFLRMKNIVLIFIGSGFFKDYCIYLAKLYRIENKTVYFIKSTFNILSLYQLADNSLLASTQESLPNFLIESKRYSLPIIAINSNGVDECFKHAKNGILIFMKNINLYKSKLFLFSKNNLGQQHLHARIKKSTLHIEKSFILFLKNNFYKIWSN